MAAKRAGESEIDTLLRGRGLRRTMPRVAVLRFLKQNPRPLSHGEIAEALEPESLDRATVYRNLIDLSDAGIVVRRDLGDHVWRFELRRADDDTGHPHFVCSACGGITCLPDDAVKIIPPRKAPRALREKDVAVELRGICDACA